MRFPVKYTIFFLILGFTSSTCIAQEDKKNMIIDLGYHLKNNHLPYLSVFAKTKEEKKFIPVSNVEVMVYMMEESEEMLIGTITTNHNGKGNLPIPPQFKSIWESQNQFIFLASSPGNENFDEASAEINITKARIVIDSVPDAEVRSIQATVMEQQGDQLLPGKDVELKIIIKRMAGNLSIGEDETFTTDEEGNAVAEFNKDNIPGDEEGYITIIAKTEDNDIYGNISVEQKLKWGVPLVTTDNFNKRTLYGTRDKAPIWLLTLAYSIALGVWGTIIYLVIQILRVRKLGLADQGN